MKFLITTAAIIFSLMSSYAQTQDTLTSSFERDSSYFRCGPPLIPGLIMLEGLLVGGSYYAAKPNAYGDKVMGGSFAGCSIFMLVSIPFDWTNKEYSKDKNFKKDRIWDAVMMLGMSYGFSRIATYNLLQADGDSFNKRFKRNLIEMNAAYIIPMGLGIITRKLLYKKSNKSQTNLLFNGKTAGLLVKF